MSENYLDTMDKVCLMCPFLSEENCENCAVRKACDAFSVRNTAFCAIFNTNGTDSEWSKRDGEKCAILRPLTESECDISDVGMMYRVQFEDGEMTDAFSDELTFCGF